MNKFITQKKEDLDKVLNHFQQEIGALRTGRANPSMLDNVLIEAYGARSTVQSLASISLADSQSLVIAPWDKSVLKDIEKGIVEAGLGVGVVSDGEKVRVTIPKMTEENRKDLVKKLNERQEQARISIRQIRDEIKTNIEKAEKEKEIPEDDKFSFVKELDEEIRKQNDGLKEMRDKKEKDIMTI